MKAEIKKLWVDALRSGEYKQAQAALKDGDRYCCLGVLCELAVRENVIKPAVETEDGYRYGRSGYGQLPPSVMRWAGLKSPMGALPDDARDTDFYSLAGANDSGKRFTTIAKLIERYF